MLELLTDFWEDYYITNPTESKRTETGEMVYTNTGDPLIDKWEQEIAQGLVPDLYEGVAKRPPKISVQEFQQQHMKLEREVAAEGFSDDYRNRL